MVRKVAAKKTTMEQEVPYDAMITCAIAILGERNGSAAIDISRYIARTFKVGSGHVANMKLHLRSAVKAGRIVLSNGRFQLPLASPVKEQDVVKRRTTKRRRRTARRGRRAARRSGRRPGRRSVRRSGKRLVKRSGKQPTRRSRRLSLRRLSLRRSSTSSIEEPITPSASVPSTRSGKRSRRGSVRSLRKSERVVSRSSVLRRSKRQAAIRARYAMKKCY